MFEFKKEQKKSVTTSLKNQCKYGKITTKRGNLNVRTKPNNKANLVSFEKLALHFNTNAIATSNQTGQLKSGTQVCWQKNFEGWLHIGNDMWVSADYVKEISPEKTKKEEPDYVKLAQKLHQALARLGTNEEKVYNALASLKKDQKKINQLKAIYKKQYGEELEKAILDDFSNTYYYGRELDQAMDLLSPKESSKTEKTNNNSKTNVKLVELKEEAEIDFKNYGTNSKILETYRKKAIEVDKNRGQKFEKDFMRMKANVGKGQKNIESDVKMVQERLVYHGYLKEVSGEVDKKTQQAIINFQDTQVGDLGESSRVRILANRESWNLLNSTKVLKDKNENFKFDPDVSDQKITDWSGKEKIDKKTLKQIEENRNSINDRTDPQLYERNRQLKLSSASKSKKTTHKGYYYSGKTIDYSKEFKESSLEAFYKLVFKEFYGSEGKTSSVNTWDGQGFTYGMGFANKGELATLMDNLLKNHKKNYNQILLEVGIKYNKGMFQVVGPDGNIYKGDKAINILKWDTRLLSFFIDLGENEKYKYDILKAQVDFIRSQYKNMGNDLIDKKTGKYIDNWNDISVRMLAHLTHWLPAFGYNNHKDEYLKTKGDMAAFLKLFVKLGANWSKNKHVYNNNVKAFPYQFDFYNNALTHFSDRNGQDVFLKAFNNYLITTNIEDNVYGDVSKIVKKVIKVQPTALSDTIQTDANTKQLKSKKTETDKILLKDGILLRVSKDKNQFFFFKN